MKMVMEANWINLSKTGEKRKYSTRNQYITAGGAKIKWIKELTEIGQEKTNSMSATPTARLWV